MLNIDFTDHQKVWAISEELLTRSKEYHQARMDYADAKYAFDLALAKELPILRIKKPNIGVETAQIMILEVEGPAKENYQNLITKENYFKGLEKILDALKSQITLFQSIIKNQTQSGG